MVCYAIEKKVKTKSLKANNKQLSITQNYHKFQNKNNFFIIDCIFRIMNKKDSKNRRLVKSVSRVKILL